MPAFCIRLQAHNALDAKYREIHAAMSRTGFKRTIRGDDGTDYQLPWGEYRWTGQADPSAVRDRVIQVVSAVHPWISVLVTEEVSSAWFGLERAVPAKLAG